jgi:hypothetical protein
MRIIEPEGKRNGFLFAQLATAVEKMHPVRRAGGFTEGCPVNAGHRNQINDE